MGSKAKKTGTELKDNVIKLDAIKEYELLMQCIRSGQAPQEDIGLLFSANSGFGKYYLDRLARKKRGSV